MNTIAQIAAPALRPGRFFMRPVQRISALLGLLGLIALVGCAGDVAAPTPLAAPVAGHDVAAAPIGRVSAEAAPGVVMISDELRRIAERVEVEMAKSYPSRIANRNGQAPNGTLNVKLVFTEYDKGNAFARAMLAGLGQIRIKANVMLHDATTGADVAKYEVSKIFSFGGIYGAATRVEDVEEGFARSVVEIFKKT